MSAYFSSQLGEATLGRLTLGVFDGLQPIDSINLWDDAVIIGVPSPSIEVADSLNNWDDTENPYSSSLGSMTLGYINLSAFSVSSIIISFGEGPTQTPGTLSDTLSQSDALVLGVGLSVTGDSLNNWSDATATGYFAPSTPQTINVASDLATRPGPGASPPKAAWKDGIAYQTNPFSGLYLSVDDLEAFLSAYAALGLGLIFSDSLNNWSDAAIPSGTPGIFAFDSMFYSIADEIAAALGTYKTQGDTLNNLSDAMSIQLFSAMAAADQMNLADLVQLNLIALPNPGDTLVMSDTNGLVLSIGMVFSDDVNNFVDLFENSPASSPYNIDNGDTLELLDEIGILANTSLSSYLRRYLNDVVN